MTDTSKADLISDIFRNLTTTLFDRPAFFLLGLIYKIFFSVATANLFDNATMLDIYKRIQLIIGIFMIFQLAITILKGIINPDEAIGSKSGIGSIITRVVMALVLLTILVPISIPGATTEYERQINNNGLLFGTLYSLQHRILANNTLGRLIIGDHSSDNSISQGDSLDRSSRIFTSTILKGFVRINLIPEAYREDPGEGRTEEMDNNNRMCKNIDDKILDIYTQVDADPGDILSLITEKCTIKTSEPWYDKSYGTKKYVFANIPIISAVVGFIFLFVLISFTVEVATRAIKLAILRLIAPIPIISYMDPKGGKDGAFSAWVKALTSTYLDLFFRLAVIYFVIFLIQDMIINGVNIDAGGGIAGALATIIVWIGLFFFAKEAPKFLRQVLGMKEGSGKGMFSGAGKLAATAGAIAGAIGSGIASGKASYMSDTVNQKKHNIGKNIVSGIVGAGVGFGTGVHAAMTAKDHHMKSAIDAIQKRNAAVIARGSEGSTMFGRLTSTAKNIFTGEGSADAISRTISTNKNRIDALKAVKSRVSGEMVKQDWTKGSLGIALDNDGNAIGDVNFKSFEANLAAARSRGDGLVNFTDVDGDNHTISLADAERQRGFLIKNNENDYLVSHISGGVNVDKRLMTLISNAEALGGSSDFTRNRDGTITKGDNKHITNRSSINDAIEGFEDYNIQLERQNAVNKANDRFANKK